MTGELCRDGVAPRTPRFLMPSAASWAIRASPRPTSSPPPSPRAFAPFPFSLSRGAHDSGRTSTNPIFRKSSEAAHGILCTREVQPGGKAEGVRSPTPRSFRAGDTPCLAGPPPPSAGELPVVPSAETAAPLRWENLRAIWQWPPGLTDGQGAQLDGVALGLHACGPASQV